MTSSCITWTSMPCNFTRMSFINALSSTCCSYIDMVCIISTSNTLCTYTNKFCIITLSHTLKLDMYFLYFLYQYPNKDNLIGLLFFDFQRVIEGLGQMCVILLCVTGVVMWDVCTIYRLQFLKQVYGSLLGNYIQMVVWNIQIVLWNVHVIIQLHTSYLQGLEWFLSFEIII